MLGTIMEKTVVRWWEMCEGTERRNERLHPARDNGWYGGRGGRCLGSVGEVRGRVR
jgi:hypothetical protein